MSTGSSLGSWTQPACIQFHLESPRRVKHCLLWMPIWSMGCWSTHLAAFTDICWELHRGVLMPSFSPAVLVCKGPVCYGSEEDHGFKYSPVVGAPGWPDRLTACLQIGSWCQDPGTRPAVGSLLSGSLLLLLPITPSAYSLSLSLSLCQINK